MEKTFTPVTSAAQWDAIEKRLDMWQSLNFLVDGHKVGTEWRRLNGNRLGIAVFIDGHIVPKLGLPHKDFVVLEGAKSLVFDPVVDPVVAAVWRRVEKKIVSSQKVKTIEFACRERRCTKKQIAEVKARSGVGKVFVYYDPVWTSVKALVHQLKKIEGIQVEW